MFISFALAWQASAVLRPLFPIKPSPPYSGEVELSIGDDLVRRLHKGRPVKQLSTLVKPGAEIKENSYGNWMNADRADR